MNSFVEILNQRGENFVSFAWPMLWQSGLLIAVLLAVDFLLRRKLRASIRYALWLVVLVKLCLPPTLALPTSPAWWLHQTPPPTAAKTMPNFTVTYDNPPLPELPPVPLAAYVPPAPTVTSASWTLIVSTVVSATLFGWLLVRWWQISRQVRRAKISEPLAGRAGEAQKIIGIKFNVPVKLTPDAMSPAVCGLFRPVILIPQTLAENFSDEQLRAVLLHELIHLRRRDVWVNFLQALLQIFYWWHPLVWLANARIRAVREEAVDDAVMLALRDEAEAYAPTLLEVAKLALNRPLASLGLVGILESRHALRQRIERLVNFSPPRQAGLTLVSLLGILAFTAVAVPMGGAPEPAETQAAPAAVAAIHPPANVLPDTNQPSILIASEIYQMRGADFEKIVAGLKFNAAGAGADAWWSASPEKFHELTASLESSGLHPITRPRIQTSSGKPAEMYVGDGTNGIEFDCTPFFAGERIDLTIAGKVVDAKSAEAVTNQFNAQTAVENHGGVVIRTKAIGGSGESNVVVVTGIELIINSAPARALKAGPGVGKMPEPLARSNAVPVNASVPRLTYTSPGRQEIVRKLSTIRLDRVDFTATPLAEVLRVLNREVRERDPDHRGINFLINPAVDQTAAGKTLDPVTGLLLATNTSPDKDVGTLPITVQLTNATLGDALDKLVLAAPAPIKYSVQDFAIVFSPHKPEVQLFTRVFKIDPARVFSKLHAGTTNQLKDNLDLLRETLERAGVDWHSPPIKALYFNERSKGVYARVTQSDLAVIERVLSELNDDERVPSELSNDPPQLHIKARFVEVSMKTFQGYVLPNFFTNSTTQRGTNFLQAVLSDQKFWAALRAMESQPGFEALAEPEATTTTGRQTQMRATQVIAVVTNVVNSTNASGSPVVQTTKVEIGQVLDVVPYVLADGYTINLAIVASLTKFRGYNAPTNGYHHSSINTMDLPTGDTIALPTTSLDVPLPVFSSFQSIATLNLWDNQTVVLAGLPETTYVNGNVVTGNSKISDKELLVFITATIVDPAGNRVHAEDELPFAAKGVPPQPPPTK